MSWQAYVDSNLLGTGKVYKAAIYGVDGSQWAISPDFDINPNEILSLIAAFDDPSDLQANGVHLEGQRYTYLRSGDKSIYARRGSEGVTLVKTRLSILIGLYNDKMQADDSTVVVESLGEYLREQGF